MKRSFALLLAAIPIVLALAKLVDILFSDPGKTRITWQNMVNVASCGWDRWQPAELPLHQPRDVRVDLALDRQDRNITVRFTSYAPGHVSIWNLDGDGDLVRLYPPEPEQDTPDAHGMPVEPRQPYRMTAYAPEVGEERVLLLWTRDAPAQPREAEYGCVRTFAAALDDLRNHRPEAWALTATRLRVD